MIRIGILGYGNIGRGIEAAVAAAPDMELAAIFTRRDPASVAVKTPGAPVVNVADLEAWTDKVDVMLSLIHI